jgi:primary-amine oxidase
VAEVTRAAAAARAHGAKLGLAKLRFNTVTLAEPPKRELLAFEHAGGPRPPRRALCVLHTPPNADVIEALVTLPAEGADTVHDWKVLPGDQLAGQPLATPDDCLLAEAVVRADPGVTALLVERGIEPSTLFLDPWAVHAAPRSKMRLIQVRRVVQHAVHTVAHRRRVACAGVLLFAPLCRRQRVRAPAGHHPVGGLGH